jgi:hypothetical protein
MRVPLLEILVRSIPGLQDNQLAFLGSLQESGSCKGSLGISCGSINQTTDYAMPFGAAGLTAWSLNIRISTGCCMTRQ